MQQFKDILTFLKKNRLIIYIILGLALMLQICSKGAQPPVEKGSKLSEKIEEIVQNPNLNFERPELPEQQPQNNFTSLLIIALVVLGFFVAKRYGWLEKLYPKIVIFRVTYYKVRSNGNLALKVVIINHTQKDITFNNPSIQFFKGHEKREFTIKNIGGQNYFPITLLPNTGHKFTIDAQKFYNQIEGLSDYKTIRMTVSSTEGKTYKSLKWPVALTFKKI